MKKLRVKSSFIVERMSANETKQFSKKPVSKVTNDAIIRYVRTKKRSPFPINSRGRIYEEDISRPKFFYISDIHVEETLLNRGLKKLEKESVSNVQMEIHKLVQEAVNGIEYNPWNDHLIVAGDTAGSFYIAALLFLELTKIWRTDKIIVVLGNHELWNNDSPEPMEQIIENYSKLFGVLRISFLQNQLLCVNHYTGFSKLISEDQIARMTQSELTEEIGEGTICVFGGIGFTGRLNEWNASEVNWGASFNKLD